MTGSHLCIGPSDLCIGPSESLIGGVTHDYTTGSDVSCISRDPHAVLKALASTVTPVGG